MEAIRYADDGTNTVPIDQDAWNDWVSAGSTRNFLLDDPLIDWLNLYGERFDFIPAHRMSGYERRTDFGEFIFRKANEFETAVIRHLGTLRDVVQIAVRPEDSRDIIKAETTLETMSKGAPIIYQGVLWDANTRTYGVPDLLVRSDVLSSLFPNCLAQSDINIPAPDLGRQHWHYRVVEIKYTTLHLLVGGGLGNTGSAPAYKAQLFMNNRALGRVQGYLPTSSYLLGRAWEQTINKTTYRSNSCMSRLAPVPQLSSSLAIAVDDAVSWIRRLRAYGDAWSVFPKPTVAELYPNMSNTSDAPWTKTKKDIAHQLEELTLLWQVGFSKRQSAHASGVFGWREAACTPMVVGITGPKQAPVLQAMLNINRTTTGPVLLPTRITSAEARWRVTPDLEFYVDFETVSDLDDDFNAMPDKGGHPMIFMVGCGHVENEQWQFICFTAERLTMDCEAEVIDAWLAHMNGVRIRLNSKSDAPTVMHWSHAEVSTLVTAYNAASQRHPDKAAAWREPQWFDILKEVMKAEPVVVRGSNAFGLKAIAQALYSHGLIQTKWDSGPTDGLGAMVGAWNCASECENQKVPLPAHPLMTEIAKYNEVDCKVMMDIIRYLRLSH